MTTKTHYFLPFMPAKEPEPLPEVYLVIASFEGPRLYNAELWQLNPGGMDFRRLQYSTHGSESGVLKQADKLVRHMLKQGVACLRVDRVEPLDNTVPKTTHIYDRLSRLE